VISLTDEQYAELCQCLHRAQQIVEQAEETNDRDASVPAETSEERPKNGEGTATQ
jgi:hypothetical protein